MSAVVYHQGRHVHGMNQTLANEKLAERKFDVMQLFTVNKQCLHLLVEQPVLGLKVDLFEVRAVNGNAGDNVPIALVQFETVKVDDSNVSALAR
jgi:hypothetical protein